MSHHFHRTEPVLENRKCKFSVPEILRKNPKYICEITHDDGTKASLGNCVTVDKKLKKPLVCWPFETHKWYTLMMIDAPVPIFPSTKNYKQWLVVNIHEDDVARGKVIDEYIPPWPPLGSGYHRYMYLVFEQLGILGFSDEKKSHGENCKTRENFIVMDWAKKYNLGDPMAGNFYWIKRENKPPQFECPYRKLCEPCKYTRFPKKLI